MLSHLGIERGLVTRKQPVQQHPDPEKAPPVINLSQHLNHHVASQRCRRTDIKTRGPTPSAHGHLCQPPSRDFEVTFLIPEILHTYIVAYIGDVAERGTAPTESRVRAL